MRAPELNLLGTRVFISISKVYTQTTLTCRVRARSLGVRLVWTIKYTQTKNARVRFIGALLGVCRIVDELCGRPRVHHRHYAVMRLMAPLKNVVSIINIHYLPT